MHKVKPLPEASAGTLGLGFEWGHEMPLGRGVPQGARKPLLAVSKLRKVGRWGSKGSAKAPFTSGKTAIRFDGV